MGQTCELAASEFRAAPSLHFFNSANRRIGLGSRLKVLPDGQPIRLNLGCGLLAPQGWVNVDGSWNARLAKLHFIRRMLSSLRILPPGKMEIPWSPSILIHDVRKPLPFTDGSVATIYASHILEHLYFHEARKLLLESFRVLAVGGALRVVVPDLKAIVEEYLGERPFGPLSGEIAALRPADRFNQRLLMRASEPPSSSLPYRIYEAWQDFHSHKWMYDQDSLVALFQGAGFVNAQPKECHVSCIENIQAVEDKSRVLNGAGICVEGIKPSRDDSPPRTDA